MEVRHVVDKQPQGRRRGFKEKIRKPETSGKPKEFKKACLEKRKKGRQL